MDPRIEIVRSWLGEDNPWEHVDRLLSRIDDASSQPPELVERVAKALFEHTCGIVNSSVPWEETDQLYWENQARASLSVLPAPMSSADREIIASAERMTDLALDLLVRGIASLEDHNASISSVYEAVERKRAASREEKP